VPPVTRYICLLRGVNLAGRNKVAMAALRELFEDLGFTQVATYIQSGNVVFTSVSRPEPSALEAAVADAFSLSVKAVVRSGTELRRVLGANPFVDRSAQSLHVGFIAEQPSAALVRELDPEACAPDLFAIRGGEAFLYLPDGMARTKLVAYLERRLGPSTVRNWRTVTALAGLAGR
jgi:uncharacterized protein (DUF1697 family)